VSEGEDRDNAVANTYTHRVTTHPPPHPHPTPPQVNKTPISHAAPFSATDTYPPPHTRLPSHTS
jgi:hypothetical protein